MAAVTIMQLLLLVVVMLVSSNIVESDPIVAPSPSQLPNEKFDLQTIQGCTSSFLDVKDCLTELFNLFHGPGGALPGGGGGGGGPSEGGGGGPPEDGGGGPPDDGGGSGGVLQGMGGGLPGIGGGLPGIGGGLPGIGGGLPGIGGGLPGIGGGNIISPVCCKTITGINKNCWPMMFPNPIVASMIDSICGPPDSY